MTHPMVTKEARLNHLIERGDISRRLGMTVLSQMQAGAEWPDEVITRMGLTQLGGEQPFKIFYRKVTDDSSHGYVERLELPDHQVVRFDETAGKINFEPLRPFVGRKLEYFIDGQFRKDVVLTSIDGDYNGVRAIEMEEVE